MKKMLLIFFCCVCLCGCEKQYDGFKIKNLSATPFSEDYFISGDITNINGKKCDTITIWFDLLGEGDLKDTVCITVDCPKKGEEKYFYEEIETELSSFKIQIDYIDID